MIKFKIDLEHTCEVEVVSAEDRGEYPQLATDSEVNSCFSTKTDKITQKADF